MTKSSVKSVSVAFFATAMVSVLGLNTAFAMVNSEIIIPTTPTATVIAESIVCDSIADLPKGGWGGFGPITSTTASTFLASHETCHVAGGWSYQYGDQNSVYAGDAFVGEAAAGLTTFGSTDSNGLTSTVISLISPNNDGVFAPIHLREVLQDGYVPFGMNSVDETNSAEFYCSDDVLNYDNFDFINTPTDQGTFYCVSWNVKKPIVENPQVCAEGTTGSYPECVPVVPVTPPTTGGTGGSTNFTYYGCTNASASNFNSLANTDDGSCVVPEGSTGGSVSGSSSSTDAVAQGEVLGASTTTEPVLPEGCSPYLSDYLKQGKNNDKAQVVLLQQFLNDYMGAKLPTNGFFGSLTKSWVKKFQVKHHAEIIKPWYDAGYSKKDIESGTGYVYKTTKYEINMIKCSNNLSEKAPDLTPDLGN